MSEPNHLCSPPDDFNGQWCQTGSDHSLAVAQGDTDYPPKKHLTYYVKSLPLTRGAVHPQHPMALNFQRACETWSAHIPITFERVFVEDGADFKIRTANAHEESEKTTSVAEAFFWSDVNAKVVKVWKRIEEWDCYSVFLHEIGHILGFRHEHVFLSAPQRALIGGNESAATYRLLQMVVDEKSIMSYGYVRQFLVGTGSASLSAIDIEQAKAYYKDKYD